MKINAISNTINPFLKKSVPDNNSLKNNLSGNLQSDVYCKSTSNSSHNDSAGDSVSFKGIYIDSLVNLGEVSEQTTPAQFLKKDSLLLNKIASQYPNQDCFIRRGYGRYPRLEYRERPPVVQVFSATVFNNYDISVDPDDKDYPCIPLLWDEDSDVNYIIGVPSYISLNPSLPYTVKVGYELHKKLIEKKYQIMEVIGRSDSVTIGEKTILERAHDDIRDIEEAVKRYLLESAYLALSKRASASQIYASNYPKVQAAMDADRKLDLTTSVAKQAEYRAQMENPDEDIDICDYAVKRYPNYNENVKVNEELQSYMLSNRLVL